MSDSGMVEKSSLASERERFDEWAKKNGYSRIRDIRDTSRYDNTHTQDAWGIWQAASAGRQELRDALILARDHIACSVCHHDETERRGLIWTECLQCGGMFADDRGGVPKPKEPLALAAIRKALGEQP